MESHLYDKSGTFVFNALIKSFRRIQKSNFSHLWEIAWEKSCQKFLGPIMTTVHGQRIAMNPGNRYPLLIRQYPTYNNPLIELVYQSYIIKNHPISFVDVGAATGDTIMLLKGNCPNMIKKFFCVDGDADFFRYLQHNLNSFEEGTLLFAMLSGSGETARELVRTHAMTASAQGNQQVPTTTLDRLLGEAGADHIDVLKIDVDGFDGEVLHGSESLLRSMRPNIIFEWHPILCAQTGNSCFLHFESLNDCGYSKFLWYDKFGNFSHFMNGYDTSEVCLYRDFCLNSKIHYDWHYDIVALHSENCINLSSLVELEYASNKPSPV